MKLAVFLSSRQRAIVDKWFETTIKDYPAETGIFLREEADPFSNPVGFHLRKGLGELYGELLLAKASDNINMTLEHLLKVRAVQDFAPSRAVGFILTLKQVVRKQLEKEVSELEMPWQELIELDSRIEALTLLAFDLYTINREKLYQIRVKELKDSIPRFFREMNDRGCPGYSPE